MSYDKGLVQEQLSQIREAIDCVTQWNQGVSASAHYTDSPDGMKTLAATCMMLEAIGEGIGKIDKRTNGTLLNAICPDIPWRDVVGIRNHIAHGYFDIDAELIFDIVSNDLAPLRQAIISLEDHIARPASEQESRTAR